MNHLKLHNIDLVYAIIRRHDSNHPIESPPPVVPTPRTAASVAEGTRKSMSAVAEKSMSESFAEVGLTAEERRLVTQWQPLLDPQVPIVAARYYAHLKTTEVGRLLTADRIDQLLAARIAHWRLLIRGDFEGVAADYAERFGRRLFDAGFPMRIFVVATDWFVVEFGRFIDAAPEIPAAVRGDLRVALGRYAFLDLLLAHASREVAYLD